MSVIKHPHQTIDGVEGKTCSLCGDWKPLTDYYKRAAGWDGLQPVCKACSVSFSREYKRIRFGYELRGHRGPSVKHVVKDGVESKMCTRCMEVLPLSEFYTVCCRWDGLESICKKCKTKMSSESRRKKFLDSYKREMSNLKTNK